MSLARLSLISHSSNYNIRDIRSAFITPTKENADKMTDTKTTKCKTNDITDENVTTAS
jgi:hypothetical protein